MHLGWRWRKTRMRLRVKSKENPYDWAGQSRHYVSRVSLLHSIRESLLNGKPCYVLGCRGMGKSSFIHELTRELQSEPLEMHLIPRPPATTSIQHACQKIGDKLLDRAKLRDASATQRQEMQRHVDQQDLEGLIFVYLDHLEQKAPQVDRLVLMLDELDGYAKPDPVTRAAWGEGFLNSLEDARKRSQGRFVLFAAGGLSVASLDSIYVSAFFSRARREIIAPFTSLELSKLAEPYQKRNTPLSAEIIDVIRLMSGGNPGLATYALENLWDEPSPTPLDVERIMHKMRDKDGDIPDRIRAAIIEEAHSNGPKLVWQKLRANDGRLTKAEFDDIMSRLDEKRANEAKWIFRMLRTSGLIRADDDVYRMFPIQVELIPSIMTLDIDYDLGESLALANSLGEQLEADLVDVLKRIHRMSIDFFDASNSIVPESVFSATLGLGLEMRGWKIEREANSNAGRTDIKARHSHFGDEVAIVEVKIWNRNDYEDIHTQVVDYWTAGVTALGTVMVGALQDEDWPDKYAKKCLDGKTPQYSKQPPPAPLAGYFTANTKQSCTVDEVDHYLLRLGKRKK